MSIVTLVVTLAVVGLLLWGINQIPMEGTIKKILNVVVIIAVILWLLSAFGLLQGVGSIRTGR
jgi:hypothetical protein